ncbi:hypothetical protein, partial [uncultured Desulfovibrio sp.]|uniref:hypothetical protein n=1 Tax=uncultured Desulfovibrio sp. TaxID=167968 RepID=UPI002618BA8E
YFTLLWPVSFGENWYSKVYAGHSLKRAGRPYMSGIHIARTAVIKFFGTILKKYMAQILILSP